MRWKIHGEFKCTEIAKKLCNREGTYIDDHIHFSVQANMCFVYVHNINIYLCTILDFHTLPGYFKTQFCRVNYKQYMVIGVVHFLVTSH